MKQMKPYIRLFSARRKIAKCYPFLSPQILGMQIKTDPMADISIEDVLALGLKEGDDIELFTERGTISVKAHPTHRVQKNVVFFYHGYSEADVNSLGCPGTHVDPHSGFPAYNSTRCGMRKKVQR